MKLGRRPGSFITFIDASSEEAVLQIASNAEGTAMISFHLYDSRGVFVMDSEGLKNFPNGEEIRAENDEVLLRVPLEPNADLQYTLYNREGSLMTCSDGVRTQIFRSLRIEGNKPLAGRPPARPVS